jgi:phosphoenolpyruvate-protein phosphotransferase (PTS system enzyme I)
MPAGTEFKGTIASDGMFAGPVTCLDTPAKARTPLGSPEREAAALADAIAAAIADITKIIGKADETAADILGFQIAMLEDEALSTPAHQAIAANLAADAAWSAALDAEIAGYEASDDEYFRARAADLRDIRDRVLNNLAGNAQSTQAAGMVLFGHDLAPTRFLETDWTKGGAIVLRSGSTTSHVAMLARARGIPMIVGLGQAATAARDAIVDATTGTVLFDPGAGAMREFASRQSAHLTERNADAAFLPRKAARRNGSAIELLINVATVEELDHIAAGTCDGIGLMRSEFLFADGKPLPGEDQQYRAYRRFLEWAEGRPVTIRTLDIGGDKPVAGLTPDGERNPFLGLRGVRLTLARPDVFRTQLRALARAAVHGNLKIMIPMVTVPEELEAVSKLLDDCIAELESQGIACARPPLGIMVEVPATAIAPELFAMADFFSIGSNDLTQYVTAASRDEPAVAALNDSMHPAVIKLIAAVARFGRDSSIPVSLCGDMASEPAHLQVLLDPGLTSFSIAPARLGRIKRALAEL